MYDVVVIGGGPAGMSAALVLGRGRKNVMMVDEEKPRNRVTHESHAFLTRDGIAPAVFREKGRRDLSRYPSITIEKDRVMSIEKTTESFFELKLSSGKLVETRRVVLATGLSEDLPDVDGIHSYYGKSIFSCPFCDGWEMRDQPLVIIAETEQSLHLIKLVRNWSDDIIIATNGKGIFTAEDKQTLHTKNITVIEEKIEKLKGSKGKLKSVVFKDGRVIERSGGFCTTSLSDKTPFINQLKLEVNEAGFVKADGMGRTSVKGIYAAGEISGPSQLIVSASQGHMTGAGIIVEDSDGLF